MAFNSETYHRNKAKRNALRHLANARAMKARLIAGTPEFLDKPERIKTYVELARLAWKAYMSHLKIHRCNTDLRRFQRGEMEYSEYMQKWGPSK